jgi:AmmeMemoRadiSam system protein B
MNTIHPIRPSPIAGSWYPANAKVLASEISGYIDGAVLPKVIGEVVGLIAPHAGYFYSGTTAGYAYRCVQGNSYDICAVFSPLHDYLPYDLMTSAHDAYSTPLGQVKIDHELALAISKKMEERAGVSLQHVANDREHSLEIQLPFLQQALIEPFLLLAVMVRTHDKPQYYDQPQRLSPLVWRVGRFYSLLVLTFLIFYTESEAQCS